MFKHSTPMSSPDTIGMFLGENAIAAIVLLLEEIMNLFHTPKVFLGIGHSLGVNSLVNSGAILGQLHSLPSHTPCTSPIK